MINLNGIDFEIDFTDADTIEIIEKEVKEVERKADELEKIKNTIPPAEGIRQACKIIKDFIDCVLGEGASQKIFGEKNSLALCTKIFKDIVEGKNKQMFDFENLVNQYSPERIER